MNAFISTVRGAAAAGLVTAGLAMPAGAETAINVTVVSGYAPTASWVKVFEDFYIPEVDRRLAEVGEYRINWNKGFSGTVVKPRGELDGISSGIADMALVAPTFHGDKLPLAGVSFVLPFATSNLKVAKDALNQIAEDVPAFKQEWEDLDTVFLGSAGSVDDYQAVCASNKPDLSDFAGAKIVGAGANLLFFSGVGAVGISSNLSEYYNQVQTGIGDCASVWAESAAAFKMYEVAPWFIKIDQGGTVAFVVAANSFFWDSLPPEVQTVLSDVALDYGDALAEYVDQVSAGALEAYAENGGTIVEYTPEQRMAWAQATPNIARDWADKTDALGKPGSEVLTRYMTYLREHGETPLRDWDKE